MSDLPRNLSGRAEMVTYAPCAPHDGGNRPNSLHEQATRARVSAVHPTQELDRRVLAVTLRTAPSVAAYRPVRQQPIG
jgi:hypothetical protein